MLQGFKSLPNFEGLVSGKYESSACWTTIFGDKVEFFSPELRELYPDLVRRLAEPFPPIQHYPGWRGPDTCILLNLPLAYHLLTCKDMYLSASSPPPIKSGLYLMLGNTY